MKKKTTRKIRRNKRTTTQRRKNRSYKWMKGGWWDKSKIVKLLTNLIINNLMEHHIRALFQQQLLPTADQPLLPTAEQPLVLKNEKEVNQRLITAYGSIIDPTQNTGKFEYKFHDTNDPTTKSIIEALKTEGISYFDILVRDKHTVAILSPDEFKKALTVPVWRRVVSTKDELVYSMFALARMVIIFTNTFNKEPAKIDLTEPVCPPMSSNS